MILAYKHSILDVLDPYQPEYQGVYEHLIKFLSAKNWPAREPETLFNFCGL